MSRNRSVFFILAILGVASSACSVYVDSKREQCKSNSDCEALGPDFAGYVCKDSLCQAPVDPTWACLDDGALEPVTGSVRVSITFVDLLSQKPLAGVSLALCNKIDGPCSFPIAQYQSNQAGQLEVDMTAGFDGYFQAEGAGIYPTLIFPPSTRKQRAPSTIPLVPASFYPTMVKGVGTLVAEDRSVVLTTSLDCLGRPAAGITISSPQADNLTLSYVLAGGMPTRTPLVTDTSGGGGFVNIPAGGIIVNSNFASNNRVVGTAGVQTRPGHVSMVLIMPNGS